MDILSNFHLNSDIFIPAIVKMTFLGFCQKPIRRQNEKWEVHSKQYPKN